MMLRKRRFVPLLAAVLVSTVLSGGAASATEELSTSTHSQFTARMSNGQAVDSREDELAVMAYWTPERMRMAVPVEEEEGSSAFGDATVSGPVAPSRASSESIQSVPGPAPSSDSEPVYDNYTVGKIFFVSRGVKYACTGTSIKTRSQRVVLTAGHCLYRQGEAVSNFCFVPGFRDGNEPFGSFAGEELLVEKEWSGSNDHDFDYGFAILGKNENGKNLGAVVGGQNTKSHLKRKREVVLFGYPSNRENGRKQQWICGPIATTAVSGADPRIQAKCDWGPGASGGPWFTSYKDRQDSLGKGFVTGVTSFGNANGYNKSPYFGDKFDQLEIAAALFGGTVA